MTAAHCPGCGASYGRECGVWRCLIPADEERVARFARDYATVREAEGWHREDAAYFRALPAVPDDDPLAAIWRRRARSFGLLVERVVAPLEGEHERPLAILDLGAGNCWLAHRLARRGHAVAAVDLLTDARDGLGAHVHYDTERIVPVQATFDRLPFAAGSVDLAVFNASLHYSADYGATLTEVLRVLRPGGRVVILDSPCYRDPASGERMVREREVAFRARHGFASDALGGVGYLTPAALRDLALRCNIHWANLDVTPFWRRVLRRWRGQLRLGREAATMPVMVGRVRGGAVAVEPNASAVETAPEGGCGHHKTDLRRLGTKPNPRRRATQRVPRPAGPQQRFHPPVSRAFRAAIRRLVRMRYLLFQRHRYDNLVLERVHGTPILVLPRVFNPQLLRTGAFLAGALDDQLIPPGAAVLDMGTGSGVGAVFAARWAGRVVAVDINSAAVRCARINALMHGLEGRIDVREGDLFAPVAGERFDVILFNPPYFRGTPRDALDRAWRSEDTVERFAVGLRDHLTPRGRALVVLSTDGDAPAFLRAFADQGFGVGIAARRDFGNEVVTVYELTVR
jgi:HemK-related putative methylase